MARKAKPPAGKSVEALRHPRADATRKNIPTAEYQSVIQKEAEQPLRVAYERRNRDLDPQLVWRGKDEQDWSDRPSATFLSAAGSVSSRCRSHGDRSGWTSADEGDLEDVYDTERHLLYVACTRAT
jgi:hypothetical protein